MTVYPIREREVLRKFEMFYTVHVKNVPSVAVYEHCDNLPDNLIARTMLEHESGLIDIFIAFLNLYPENTITIDTRPILKYPGKTKTGKQVMKNYRPDAIIRMETLDGHHYHFIVEFERTATNKDIRVNKFVVNNILGAPQKHGLSKYTKYLYVYSREYYDIYTRPLEYDRDLVKKQHAAIERELGLLIKDNGDLLNDRFRFLPHHLFNRLNEAVWLDHKFNKIKLLNF